MDARRPATMELLRGRTKFHVRYRLLGEWTFTFVVSLITTTMGRQQLTTILNNERYVGEIIQVKIILANRST